MIQEKIYGIHSVLARLKNNENIVKFLYLQNNREDKKFRLIKTIAKEKEIPVKILSSVEFARIIRKDKVHQGVIAIVNQKSHNNTLSSIIRRKGSKLRILVLERVQDPHNLGACIRSANSMNIDAIIITSNHTAQDTEIVQKVSSGALENTAVFRVINLQRVLKILKKIGILIIGTAIESRVSLYHFKENGAIALIMGNEQRGIRALTKDCCDEIVSIPMYGDVESLNVSVSTSVFLYELCRRRYLG